MQSSFTADSPRSITTGTPTRAGAALLALLLLVGPAHAQGATAVAGKKAPSGQMKPAAPQIAIHKDPNCGCCKVWAAHLRNAGFKVTEHEEDDMALIKRKLGVPEGKYSCHTAEVDGYVIEGHVPAADIKRLLAERPDAKGLTVPGMPLGSPGMEVPDGRADAYTVELFKADGSSAPYAEYQSKAADAH